MSPHAVQFLSPKSLHPIKISSQKKEREKESDTCILKDIIQPDVYDVYDSWYWGAFLIPQPRKSWFLELKRIDQVARWMGIGTGVPVVLTSGLLKRLSLKTFHIYWNNLRWRQVPTAPAIAIHLSPNCESQGCLPSPPASSIRIPSSSGFI